MKTYKCVIFCVLMLSLTVHAAQFGGKVVSVKDGDTITILTSENRSLDIRIYGIDAPEKKQPFGQKSQESLSDICAGKTATIVPMDNDRYERIIGVVACDGNNAAEHQLQNGMAWAYEYYLDDVKLREIYINLQTTARKNCKGLWIETNPVPPWDWRRR